MNSKGLYHASFDMTEQFKKPIARGRGVKLSNPRKGVLVTIRNIPLDQEFLIEVEKYSSENNLNLSDTIKQLVLFAASAKKAGAIIENGILKKIEAL